MVHDLGSHIERDDTFDADMMDDLERLTANASKLSEYSGMGRFRRYSQLLSSGSLYYNPIHCTFPIVPWLILVV